MAQKRNNKESERPREGTREKTTEHKSEGMLVRQGRRDRVGQKERETERDRRVPWGTSGGRKERKLDEGKRSSDGARSDLCVSGAPFDHQAQPCLSVLAEIDTSAQSPSL